MCSVLYLSQTRGCDICPDTLICEVRVQTSTLPVKHQSDQSRTVRARPACITEKGLLL